MRRLIIAIAAFVLAFAMTSHVASAEPSASRSDLDAATAVHRAYQAAATPRERELLQYRLAIALYRAKFHQAAFAIFSEIADHPNHAEFQSTLVWLAQLGTDLPEPADVEERVGKYDELSIDRLKSSQRELFWQLSYMLGRYKYRNRRYEDSLRLFSKVDRTSRFFFKAQVYSGLANVQMRRATEAIRAFQQIVRAADEETEGAEDPQRMRDLALLSIARTYYSASIRIDPRGVPAIDTNMLGVAVKYWRGVDARSEYWIDALFEQSWAEFMVGDHARALGNIYTLQSGFFPSAYNPEVDILKSAIYLANCQYDDATTLAARFQAKYQPIASELTKTMSALPGADQDESFYRLARDVRDGRGNVSSVIRPVVERALGDRDLLRHLEYVLVLENEQKRFASTPPSFHDSPLGDDIKDGLQLARDIAVRNAAELARDRYRRQLGELDKHLRDNVGLLAGAMAGQRGELDQAFLPMRIPGNQSERNVVRGDEEHVIWPFTGEIWSDEVGSYRQSIRSKCR